MLSLDSWKLLLQDLPLWCILYSSINYNICKKYWKKKFLCSRHQETSSCDSHQLSMSSQ